MVNSVIKSHMLEIEILCENYGVKALYATGKASKGEIDDENEINFIIDFNGLSDDYATTIKRYKITHMLEIVLQHKIDIKTKGEYKEPISKEGFTLLFGK